MAAVLGGDMDVYIGSTSAALRAATQTEDAVIAGALMTEYASNVVMRGEIARERGLDEDSTVRGASGGSRRGLNIGVTGAGSGTHQLALFMLTQAELDPERDATVVFVGGSTENPWPPSRGTASMPSRSPIPRAIPPSAIMTASCCSTRLRVSSPVSMTSSTSR